MTYFEDATNSSQEYFRNRIRQNVVPELKKENSQVLEHAQQFHQQLIWANQLIDQSLKENLRNIEFDGRRWSFSDEILPAETGARYYFLSAFFQQTAEQTTFIISQRQLFALLDQIQHSGSQWIMDLGDNWQFARRYQQFVLEKKAKVDKGVFRLSENERCSLSDGTTIALKKAI